jgi:EPS-associated MarR family transcriptional regulator
MNNIVPCPETMPSPNANLSVDAETASLAVLRLLEADPLLTQRGLSAALGLSLGKTHYVLHALLDSGLVKIENFRRSDNKRAYAYLLTGNGLKEKLRLTRIFLARKEAEFEQLKATIATLRQEIDPPHSLNSAKP